VRRARVAKGQDGGPGCCKISTIEKISSIVPNAISAYRTPHSRNELPIPARNSTAPRNTVIRIPATKAAALGRGWWVSAPSQFARRGKNALLQVVERMIAFCSLAGCGIAGSGLSGPG
jgi:hypothetical protein